MGESASHAGAPRYPSLPRRLASGLVLGAVTVLAVWFGGWGFHALLILALLLSLWEFLRMGAAAGYPVLMTAGLTGGLVMLAGEVPEVAEYRGPLLTVIAVAAVVQSFRPPLEKRLWGLALTAGGLVYIVGLGVHLFYLRELSHQVLLVVLLGTWAADTAAFFVGIGFGRNLLAPAISPKKTVEGLVGGVVGAGIVVGVAARFLLPDLGIPGGVLVGGVIGILSPVGDLLESLIKRNLQTKDTSRLIPGHGGVLDRIDSLLMVAPASYYLFRFLMN